MASSSPGVTPARCIALRPASTPMEQVDSPFFAMYRWWIPERSTIQSCEVSMPIDAKSWFVITCDGSPRPVPAKYAIGRFTP
jgi:hypothetical protein